MDIMRYSEDTPELIVWKALSTLAIIALTAWYGTTFVGAGAPQTVAHHQTAAHN